MFSEAAGEGAVCEWAADEAATARALLAQRGRMAENRERGGRAWRGLGERDTEGDRWRGALAGGRARHEGGGGGGGV